MKIGLTSNQQTFLDLTDSTRLDVIIASNLPTIQIKDITQSPVVYSPSWETVPLVLTPSSFLNSSEATSSTTFTWMRQDGSATPVALSTNESVTNGILTVNANNLAASASGVITYICTATNTNGLTATAKVSFSLIVSGATSVSDNASVTFQLYAPNGYVLSNTISSLTLQTMAYIGGAPIQTGDAIYKWYEQKDGEWSLVQDGTSSQFVVTRNMVEQYKNFKCDMTYGDNIYTATIMVEDKGDVYNSLVCISSNANTMTGDYYWIVYALIYNQNGEIDPLLGPISVTPPESPKENDYWYSVDGENEMVMLKQYDGVTWVDAVAPQSLSYYWSMIGDDGGDIPLGESHKIKIISCHDFTTTATFKCDIMNQAEGIISVCTLGLTDASDPIISSVAPTNVTDGQIWIKKNTNGTYLMFIWDASEDTWISADSDMKNKIYTSRPLSYNVGDLWITSSDDDHGTYLQGTLLQAQVSRTEYNGADWLPTLKYDSELDEIHNTLNNLSQYVRINSNGLQIGAKTASGETSPFTSLFTSTELSFYQDSDKLLTLANNKLTAPRAEIEDNLVVRGSIQLIDLVFFQEDNGSYSLATRS